VCSRRFPYYMNTYGFHTNPWPRAGRSHRSQDHHPELACGLRRDGDSRPSAAPPIHCLRPERRHQLLMFNNNNFGLDGGAVFRRRSNSQENPVPRLRHADTRFILWPGDRRQYVPFRGPLGGRLLAHLNDTLKQTAAHKGSAYVDSLHTCNIFNDGSWFVSHGKRPRRSRRPSGSTATSNLTARPGQGHPPARGIGTEVVHLATATELTKRFASYTTRPSNPAYAFLLAQMRHASASPPPIGVLRFLHPSL